MRSSPGWLLRRLSRMSPPEIVYRFRHGVRNLGERLLTRNRTPLRRIDRVEGNEWAAPCWFVDLGDRDVCRDAARRFGWTQQRADDYLAHRFSFFAFEGEDFGRVIRWNFDYRNGVATPMDYGPSLDYRDEARCGDIKYAWEHNRHHHLVELAKAWYLTGDPEYAQEVTRQVDGWISDCPHPFGIGWASSLECAIRVINWSFSFAFLLAGPSDRWKPDQSFLRRWTASVEEHLRFISRRFSLYSSANNHLIGEAAGLFVGAVCFSFRGSPGWRSRAAAILEREALKQISPDGVTREQALSYQGFVYVFLLLAGLMGRRNGLEFSRAYWDRLERVVECFASLLDDDGRVPRIGDDDEGFVVRLCHHPGFRPYRSMVASGAQVFRRPDLAAAAGEGDEEAWWLAGDKGWKKLLEQGARPFRRDSFPEGGYYILRGDDARVVFDCGPLGYLSLAAHGHADALSVQLDYRGHPVLIDPGTYAYHTQRRWRDYFRGTAAHNTLRLDGVDQSVIGGNFLWLRKARCMLLTYDGSRVCGRHDGYLRLSNPVIHEREVLFDRGERRIHVADRILGKGRHAAELFFHCAPESRCSATSDGWEVVNGDAGIRIVPDAGLPGRSVHIGSHDPVAGWYSSVFDRKAPSPTLVASGIIEGGVTLRTVIHLLEPQ